jgi:hypothetical protein
VGTAPNKDPDSYAVVIVDEAHRIRARTVPRVPTSERPTISQIEELVRVAKVLVLFLDENQIISPKEAGEPAAVREVAERYGITPREFALTAQFRCSGSNHYIAWLDAVLGLAPEPLIEPLDPSQGMHFDIVESPHDLRRRIEEFNRTEPRSARLLAGWCWPWSNPTPDGALVDDVTIDDFRMPWELKNGKRAPGLPEAKHWAIDPAGEGQIGTVYSVQGFEMKHVGIIFGPDLVWREPSGWVARPKENCSPDLHSIQPERARPYLQRIYRTLMSRGTKSCSVFFVDAETRAHFEAYLRA